jgi:predicted DNA-binding protein
MAKENVSARVPPEIAEGIDEYAETWNMNRTDAMTVILKAGLEANPEPGCVGTNRSNHTYTLALDSEKADMLSEAARATETTPPEYVKGLIEAHLADLE